jgi:NTP pyrophosphatase (non-canonical NTP hydrolase)
MEWKLEDLTMEQLKEVSEAINKEINERKNKFELEHAKALLNALYTCLDENNPFTNGYMYLYSNEHCEDLEFNLSEVLYTILNNLKSDIDDYKDN